jgi:tetratricopeptide (TPR) repeat protein
MVAFSQRKILEHQAGIRDCEFSIRCADQYDNPTWIIQEENKTIARHRAEIDKIYLGISKDRQKQALSESHLRKGILQVTKACSALYSDCIQHHGDQRSYYDRSLLHYDIGDVVGCLQDIEHFVVTGEKAPAYTTGVDHLYLRGIAYSDLGLYNQAVDALTEAIRLNPENKDAYLERAGAYFELGDLDQALLDFSSSSYRSTPILQETSIEYASGFIAGALIGAAEAVAEFVPSTLNSLRGLSAGIWTLVSSPIQFSREMAHACQLAAEYLSSHSTPEILQELAPELKDLVINWDMLSRFNRARLMGHSIAKYGVEIFAPIGLFKGVKVYQELRKANMMLTLESFGYSAEARVKLFEEMNARWKSRELFREQTNLQVEHQKHWKHIEGHVNYKQGNSILAHSDIQRLVNEFKGTGMRWRGEIPGAPGYIEVVDFHEFIGFDVNPDTYIRTPTSWGKIHYSKSGVHVVPTKPRGKI